MGEEIPYSQDRDWILEMFELLVEALDSVERLF